MAQSREDIINQLLENMNSFKRGMHTHMQAYFQDIPVPRSQLEVLFVINHLQPVSFKQIAQHLNLTPGAVSQLVDGLSGHGLISRETDPSDRRIVCLRLSKKGDKLLLDIGKRRRAMVAQVMHDLDTDELELWLRVQQKMAAHFQAAVTKKDKEVK